MVASRNAMMTPPRSSPRSGIAYRRAVPGALARAVAEQAAQLYGPTRAAATAVRVARAIARTVPYRGRTSGGSRTAVRTGGQPRYVTTGKYRGKFKRQRRAKGNVYAENGFLNTTEVSGTVSDPDCVYIVHAAADPYLIVGHAVEALVRKLVAKAGTSVNSVTEIVPVSGPVSAANWVFKLIMAQRGNPTPQEYVTNTFPVTSTGFSIRDMATPMLTHFMQYSSGYTTSPLGGGLNNTFEPYFLQLYSVDYSGTGNTDRILASLDLRNETVVYYSKSSLKIQNRTKAADGGVDATNVNNNPLVGRSYTFSGIPNPRQMGAYPLGRIAVNRGVGLSTAAIMMGTSGGPGYKEPPKSVAFTNCKMTAKVRLNPGDVKTSTIYTSGSKSFLPWLKAIRLQYGPQFAGDLNYYSTYSMFKSQMFALEDLINVNLSEVISCAYEVNRESGIYFKTTGKNAAITGFDQLSYSL